MKEYDGLLSLVKSTRAHLPAEMVITMAYYPDSRQERMLKEREMDEFVDFLHMMTYDQQTGTTAETMTHSTAEFTSNAVHQGLRSGLDGHKLTVGVPFYGRNSRSGDWTTYEDIVQTYHPLAPSADIAVVVQGGKEIKGKGVSETDETAAKPTSYIGYNGIATIQAKVAEARSLHLGGVMIWEVGQDCRVVETVRVGQTHGVTCPNGKNSSLLQAISDSLA